MRINNQPQLEIFLQFKSREGERVTASAREIVSVAHLPQVQPGAMLPSRYDPDNPHKIMHDRSTEKEELQAAYNRHMIAIGVSSQEMVDIANDGVKAQGVVLSSRPTGNIINSWGEMTLSIRVARPNNGSSFDTVVNKAIPTHMLLNVQPGAVLDVYYLPENDQEGKSPIPVSIAIQIESLYLPSLRPPSRNLMP